jgi:hypothetical protein
MVTHASPRGSGALSGDNSGLAPSINPATGQFPARARDRPPRWLSKALGSRGMAVGGFALVQPIVVHSEFLGRLDQAKVSLRTAPRAAESLGPVIDIMQPCELQTGVAAADIATQPHLPVGLGERAEGEGTMRPGSNHAAKLERAGGQ